MRKRLQAALRESLALQQQILDDQALLSEVEKIAEVCIQCFKQGGKVLFCGNGGSAAQAQHLSGELSGRFYLDRPPLFSEALHVNTSFLTAIANDYDFSEVYARMLEAMGSPKDVLFLLSTSGNSPNILKAAAKGKTLNITTVGMTGASGGQLATAVDYLIKIPSKDTPRIQEAHLFLGHLICEWIEKSLFENV